MTSRRKAVRSAVVAAGLMIILLSAGSMSLAQEPAPAPAPSVAPQAPPAAPQTPPASSEYLLGPQDVLDIVVFGETDLTKSVTVRPDGKITLPLVGEMLVTGLTATQVADRLTSMLKTYLKTPRVSVTLSKARDDAIRFFVYLVGQVKSPGAYEMKKGWTVMEAIAEAGGVTTKAALRKASLIRRATSQSIPLDLDKLVIKGDQAANVALEGGDVVLVPEFQNRVLVWGTVKSPGAFDLNDGARVMDALAAAGGPDAKAHLESVGIIRQTAEGQRALVATVDVNKILKNADQKQNIVLQHADIVYVPLANRFSFQEVLSWLSGFSLIKALFGF